jgi:hydrogenase/urease accessory protein HupE
MLISPFLPWVHVFGRSYSFFEAADLADDSSGIAELFVIAAVAVLGGVLRLGDRLNTKTARIWAAVVGSFGLLEAFYRYNKFSDVRGSVSVGFGVWALALSSLAVLVGAFLDREGDA